MDPLWIIDPSLHCPEDQGVEEIRRCCPGPSRVFRPVLHPGEGPTAASGYDARGVVLMGSAASVYDDAGWLEELGSWLGPILSGEVAVPLLGICFGHQFVAHLAGAEVGFLAPDRAKRCGVETSRFAGDRLLAGPRDLRVVVSHREIVREAPADYRITASREGVAVDGLEHARLPIHSFQFHPEAREEFALRVGIPGDRIDARLRSDSAALISAFGATLADRSE